MKDNNRKKFISPWAASKTKSSNVLIPVLQLATIAGGMGMVAYRGILDSTHLYDQTWRPHDSLAMFMITNAAIMSGLVVSGMFTKKGSAAKGFVPHFIAGTMLLTAFSFPVHMMATATAAAYRLRHGLEIYDPKGRPVFDKTGQVIQYPADLKVPTPGLGPLAAS